MSFFFSAFIRSEHSSCGKVILLIFSTLQFFLKTFTDFHCSTSFKVYLVLIDPGLSAEILIHAAFEICSFVVFSTSSATILKSKKFFGSIKVAIKGFDGVADAMRRTKSNGTSHFSTLFLFSICAKSLLQLKNECPETKNF